MPCFGHNPPTVVDLWGDNTQELLCGTGLTAGPEMTDTNGAQVQRVLVRSVTGKCGSLAKGNLPNWKCERLTQNTGGGRRRNKKTRKNKSSRRHKKTRRH